jgi:hypothetical protein
LSALASAEGADCAKHPRRRRANRRRGRSERRCGVSVERLCAERKNSPNVTTRYTPKHKDMTTKILSILNFPKFFINLVAIKPFQWIFIGYLFIT